MTWQETKKGLEKTFTFSNFAKALVFVNTVGRLAEKQKHHPNILMHEWNKVTISTITHDSQSITEKDHILTKYIDESIEQSKGE